MPASHISDGAPHVGRGSVFGGDSNYTDSHAVSTGLEYDLKRSGENERARQFETLGHATYSAARSRWGDFLDPLLELEFQREHMPMSRIIRFTWLLSGITVFLFVISFCLSDFFVEWMKELRGEESVVFKDIETRYPSNVSASHLAYTQLVCIALTLVFFMVIIVIATIELRKQKEAQERGEKRATPAHILQCLHWVLVTSNQLFVVALGLFLTLPATGLGLWSAMFNLSIKKYIAPSTVIGVLFSTVITIAFHKTPALAYLSSELRYGEYPMMWLWAQLGIFFMVLIYIDRHDHHVREKFLISKQIKDHARMAHTLVRSLVPDSLVAPVIDANLLITAPIVEHYDETTVMVLDIVGFTELSSLHTAATLVALLNGVFSRFDAVCARFGVYKVTTVGDAYVCVAGAPKRQLDHAIRVFNAACRMVGQLGEINKLFNEDLRVRIGIASGPVSGGLLDQARMAYSLFGGTVTVADTLSAKGDHNTIVASPETWGLLRASWPTRFPPVKAASLEVSAGILGCMTLPVKYVHSKQGRPLQLAYDARRHTMLRAQSSGVSRSSVGTAHTVSTVRAESDVSLPGTVVRAVEGTVSSTSLSTEQDSGTALIPPHQDHSVGGKQSAQYTPRAPVARSASRDTVTSVGGIGIQPNDLVDDSTDIAAPAKSHIDEEGGAEDEVTVLESMIAARSGIDTSMNWMTVEFRDPRLATAFATYQTHISYREHREIELMWIAFFLSLVYCVVVPCMVHANFQGEAPFDEIAWLVFLFMGGQVLYLWSKGLVWWKRERVFVLAAMIGILCYPVSLNDRIPGFLQTVIFAKGATFFCCFTLMGSSLMILIFGMIGVTVVFGAHGLFETSIFDFARLLPIAILSLSLVGAVYANKVTEKLSYIEYHRAHEFKSVSTDLLNNILPERIAARLLQKLNKGPKQEPTSSSDVVPLPPLATSKRSLPSKGMNASKASIKEYMVRDMSQLSEFSHMSGRSDMSEEEEEDEGTEIEIAESIPDSVIIFVQIADFRQVLEKTSDKDLAHVIHRISQTFDSLCAQYNIEKIKTIPHTGTWLASHDAAEQREFARTAIRFAVDHIQESHAWGLDGVEISVGIASGRIVKGVIGKTKFAWDLWGAPVNRAARMATSAQRGWVQMEPFIAHQALKTTDEFPLQEREEIEVKGIGKMKPWYMHVKKDTPGHIEYGEVGDASLSRSAAGRIMATIASELSTPGIDMMTAVVRSHSQTNSIHSANSGRLV